MTSSQPLLTLWSAAMFTPAFESECQSWSWDNPEYDCLSYYTRIHETNDPGLRRCIVSTVGLWGRIPMDDDDLGESWISERSYHCCRRRSKTELVEDQRLPRLNSACWWQIMRPMMKTWLPTALWEFLVPLPSSRCHNCSIKHLRLTLSFSKGCCWRLGTPEKLEISVCYNCSWHTHTHTQRVVYKTRHMWEQWGERKTKDQKIGGKTKIRHDKNNLWSKTGSDQKTKQRGMNTNMKRSDS